ncbi:hypothetical protein [Serratia sp. OS31]|uniref:hypothetical protein n=1 Tax=Serratia sp. OS31 TaxID=2760844 RepID=UPI0016043B89|nr:hypothetical protein [Serratia sp. OS31]MBB1581202.1 hypothetical protein [Serratia sp. OS31]
MTQQLISSIENLRILEPSLTGQRVFLCSYYDDSKTPFGGGDFYYDETDTKTPDDAGTTIVTATGKRWKRVESQKREWYASWFGLDPSLQDCSPALQRIASSARKRTVILPQAPRANPMRLMSPIYFQNNCGIHLIGHGAKDRTVFSDMRGTDNENQALLNFPSKNNPLWGGSEQGYAGIILENFSLLGNPLYLGDGLYLQAQYRATYRNITIEDFNGCALFIDKCQDSVFDAVDIWGSGSSSGDRKNPVDSFNISKTLKNPIMIRSSYGSDRANFLRFNNCQFEDNWVCPVFSTIGGICCEFNSCHIEYNANVDVTNTNGGTFFQGSEGVYTFNDGGIAEYRVISIGHCELYMYNVRCTPGIDLSMTSGSNSRVYIHRTNISSLSALATSSFKVFDNCIFTKDIAISYPDNLTYFDNCEFRGKVTGTSSSNGNIGVYFKSCHFSSEINFNSAARNIFIIGGYVIGDVSFGSGGGVFNPTKHNGALIQSSVDPYYIQPTRKQSIGANAPASGTYRIGDIRYNTAPTAGAFIGWICISAGSPGVWKGFGAIAA